MKDTIRRFVPVDSLDIAAMESWLADLAEDGLFLVSFGTLFANFESCPPRKAAYRLEATVFPLVEPDKKKRELLEDFGWEYICPFGKYFHVYCAKTENAPEIHTDPAIQAEVYEQIYRSQRNWGILYCSIYTLMLLALVFVRKPGFFNIILNIGFFLTFGAYMAAFAILGIIQFLRLRRIKNLLKNGTPLSHSGDYRKKRWRHISANVFIFLLFLSVLLVRFCKPAIAWDVDWRELSEPIPMVSLAEIEQDSGFANGHIDDENTTYIGGDSDNEIRFDSSFLAPEQITITQSGFVPGRNWVDDGRPYESTLKISIYRLRFPSMGARFVESQMDWELFDLIPWDTLDLSSETGLEEAHLCVSGKFGDALKKLFLRQGDTVMFVEYIGEADLRPFVPQFAALMQETYPTKKPR